MGHTCAHTLLGREALLADPRREADPGPAAFCSIRWCSLLTLGRGSVHRWVQHCVCVSCTPLCTHTRARTWAPPAQGRRQPRLCWDAQRRLVRPRASLPRARKPVVSFVRLQVQVHDRGACPAAALVVPTTCQPREPPGTARLPANRYRARVRQRDPLAGIRGRACRAQHFTAGT